MKFIIGILFALPLLAQTNASIFYTPTAPSGGCTARASLRLWVPIGGLYACLNGTWGRIGGTGGTVTGVIGTANEITVVNGTTTPGISVAQTFDISGHTSTAPMKKGTSLPVTCNVGEFYNKTDATAGQNIYGCTSANTWTAQGGSTSASITQGTFAALPGTCTTGDLYFVTDSAISEARCSATNTWSYFLSGIGLVTPPVFGNFSWVNQGTATATTTFNGIVLTSTTEASFQVRSLVKAAPATPYHIIACYMTAQNQSTNNMFGLIFRNSSSGKINIFGPLGGGTTPQTVTFANSSNTANTGTPVNSTSNWIRSPYICLRIGDDGMTNRTYDVSGDGTRTWTNLGSDARTSNFTADQVGIFVNGGVQSAHFVHYAETN